MILGYVFLILALTLTVAANVLWVLGRVPKREGLLTWAKRAVVGATGAIVASAGYLTYLIATHQFQVAYVAEYSAKRSSSWYLLAAFWGGQEGSILLWAFMGAILGTVLAFKAGSRTSRVWPIYGLIQVFLLSLLLVKCPFVLGTGPVPNDGRGLNPLLENMWMVIHPPMLFLGFSALMPVFAWCVYGLVYRDWDGWAKAAYPWVLFAFASLGFGLSLGGYWAYETLGWGGFWGWDPVENSSLVPWLAITALIHGLLLQQKNGGYKVSNFLLGFLPFAYMCWGTFLTRTGLLTDFSVHSFSAISANGYYMLLGGVLTSVFVPLGLLIARGRSIPKPAAYDKVLTREFGFFLASALIGLMGIIVAIGMSAPLLTKIWMTKGAAAQPEFYNQALYPLAILMAVAMAATPYLAWKGGNESEVGKRLLKPYIAALVLTMALTVTGFLLGIRKPLMILLFACSALTVTANLALVLPRLRTKAARKTVGGFVAHAGAGLTLAGVACLVTFSAEQKQVSLVRDRPVNALGYTFTYKGQTHQPYDRDNNALRLEVRRGKYVWEARPRYYVAPWANEDTVFANPPAILPSIYNVKSAKDVLRLLPWNNPFVWGDLYIATNQEPQSLEAPMLPPSPNKGFTLGPSETKTIGEYTFTLRDLSLDENARKAQGSRKEIEKLPQIYVQATVDVTYRGKTGTVVSRLKLEPTGGAYALPVQIPGPDGRTVMLKMDVPKGDDAPQRQLSLRTLNADDPTEMVVVDVSTKPGVGLVWLGSLLYTLGGLVAYRRRANELGMKQLEPFVEVPPTLSVGKNLDAAKPAPRPKAKGKRTPEPARAE